MSVFAASNMLQIYINPALGLWQIELCEGYEIMVGCSGKERYSGGGIRLVCFKIEEYADG